jgi:D-serine deaminase-like pyridoxal phosphate-dependent protein
MGVGELRTPAAMVDLEVLERNADRMAKRAARLGVMLRPHVKTHKTLEAARIQVRGHSGGIAVSTLAEAEFFAAGGFRDITYAVPIAPAKLAEAIALATRLDRFSLLVDHPEAAAALEAFAREHGLRVSLFLKVDCGAHRAGVDPERDESAALAARLAASPYLDFRGILTHAGQAYRCHDAIEIRGVAAHERDVMVAFAERLRADGIRVDEVSIGSTPTAAVVDGLAGVTELRPGNYVFFDAFQAAIGSCSLTDVAFTVVVRVIGQYIERQELLVDGGALALSKDPGPVHIDPGCGFGVVLTVTGERLPGWRVVSLSQEHGIVRSAAPFSPGAFPIDSLLRIIPNHSCLAAAMFDRYAVMRGGEVIDEWHPVRGW